ncbi:TetR/AcrR family transcriptional regulator [Hoyosella sp. YIM 151337]|uniref:TetR/AcrR family transcriptional regulator n=1 Tax=Hoyosella sp. YIM 151337 TaxID=2992742 RepID=UPI002235F7B0|nr:TetR/AcrR family transcriptional regulator [Hoyosella sp. YIM 151337]MCW4353269.1 TetR/AcrR family transcriptional regulator [Hoyosella sp. YIM 151337]
MAKGKWTKQMWIDAALRAIARGGVSSVAVDNLATELGATRGSFYWHFKDRCDLIEKSMVAWEEMETGRVERSMAEIADPVERMRTGFLIALADVNDTSIPNLEPAIYAQPEDPAVAAVIQRVNARRIDILTRGYTDLGLPPETARLQAVLAYATYLGWLQLQRIAADEVPEVATEGPAAQAFAVHIIEQLVPGGQDGNR